MKHTMKDIPDLGSSKYPERVNIAVTREAYLKLRYLRASGKDAAEYLRRVLDDALAGVPLPQDTKKTG